MSKAEDLINNINKVIVGKNDVVELVVTSLITGGHVLIEDMPGTGKTMLCKALAKSVDANFGRVQFTPDLLPSDITGLNVYNQKTGEFVFYKGPVFCNILLGDEINRATPRTQSSLLECMEEKQVTIDRETRQLEAPFFVIATENPIETAGTFPLPEAQLDRFLMRLSMGMIGGKEERELLKQKAKGEVINNIEAVCTRQDIIEMQKEAENVYVHYELIDYICSICEATREKTDITAGVSPRGAIALMKAARSYAYIHNRNYVVPEDVKALAIPVLAHRLVLFEGVAGRKSYEDRRKGIVEEIAVATEDWSYYYEID
uniref:AAA family ATPase n=1 Tax=Eshraghiella crossota TaxID=45851 RepID=UPI00402607CE